MSGRKGAVETDSDAASEMPASLSSGPVAGLLLKLSRRGTNWRDLRVCLIYLIAVVVAVYGSRVIAGAADLSGKSPGNLAAGAPWMGIAFLLWIWGGLSDGAQSTLNWSRELGRVDRRLQLAGIVPGLCWLTALLLVIASMTAESALPALRGAAVMAVAGALAGVVKGRLSRRSRAQSPRIVAAPPPLIPRLRRRSAISLLLTRAPLFVLACLSSALVWQNSSGAMLPQPYFELWLASAALWSLALAPRGWSIFDWATGKIDMLRRFSWRSHGWVVLAFAGIMILGAAFRFAELDSVPRDMFNHDQETEIHIAYGFAQGEYPIVAFTYQAQQTLHGYFYALFSGLTGLGFDFMSLKLFTAVTSLFTLPLVFWAGVEVMGRGQRQRGIVLGLIAMGLVAVSYWYVVIVRTGLRNHLTAPFTALVFVLLARAMRHNRRSDFLKLGLALGFGAYAHNACLVLPLAVVIGIALAMACRRITVKDAMRYLVNLIASGLITIVVYLPMQRVAQEFPDPYYRVSLENMFDYEAGSPIVFDLDVFLTGLLANFRDALLMLHWLGDHQSYWSATYRPALDIYSGGCLLLGLAVWLLGLLRRPRDPVWLLLPVMVLVMLLPSTMAVMRPENNPSNMRTAGAMPPLYLLAALPIVEIAFCLAKAFPRWLGKVLALLFGCALLLLANQRNSELYFNFYGVKYDTAPYSNVGKTIRSLADSGTPLSNIFVVAHPHFWHGRNVFVEAGAPRFLNETGISRVQTHIEEARQRGDEFRLDPARDLVFLHAPQDELTARTLPLLFPKGRSMLIRSDLPADHPLGSYMLFRAPALGDGGLDALREMPQS